MVSSGPPTPERDEEETGQVDVDGGVERDERNHRFTLHANDTPSVLIPGDTTAMDINGPIFHVDMERELTRQS